MIDYVKVIIIDKKFARQLRQNPLFNFECLVNPDTGEQRDDTLRGELKNLKITIYSSGLVEVKGSLHKFANGGTHNYDVFTFERLSNTIAEVTQLLGIDPIRANLHNVEFGVNITLDYHPTTFLESILNYKFKLPDSRTFRGKGHLLQWEFQNYTVKAYDKKKQYRLDTNVLRFEVKSMSMKHLAKVGVSTLGDLLNIQKLRRLGDMLCDTFRHLVVGEKLNVSAMTKAEKRMYEQGMSPYFWRDMTDRKKRNYFRCRFEDIIKKYGSGMRETVEELIQNQIEGLLKT